MVAGSYSVWPLRLQKKTQQGFSTFKDTYMDIERYRYQGRLGIVFHVGRFIVQPSDRANLYSLRFCEVRTAHYEVTRLIVQLYDKMLAQERPCLMMIAFSQPLTREQADRLNEQRTLVSMLTSTAFGAMAAALPGGEVAKRVGRFVLGAGASRFVGGKLPTYHAGDIILSLVATVEGGIGPQQSSSSMILKSGK